MKYKYQMHMHTFACSACALSNAQEYAKALFEGIQGFVKDFTAQQLPTVVVAPVFTSLAVVESVKCDCGCGDGGL